MGFLLLMFSLIVTFVWVAVLAILIAHFWLWILLALAVIVTFRVVRRRAGSLPSSTLPTNDDLYRR